jgi:hypothetical protein
VSVLRCRGECEKLGAAMTIRATLEQHMRDIRRLFAEALAARLGRDVGDIREEGLAAGDFKVNESVELDLADGSTMALRYAFVVVDSKRRIAGVFSEHCGYYCFGMTDLHIRELRDGAVVATHGGAKLTAGGA